MAEHTHDHPSNPIPYYVGVFAVLLLFTGLTVFVARYDWGPYNILVALTIAVIKATSVVMIFMHVKWSSRLTQLIVVSGLFWLMIMLAFTLSDYYSRGGWPTNLGQ
jgi:cytochrome c oxidase subunit 4